MNIVCLPETAGSTVFATGVLSTYALKMSSSSASVGLSALGSISLPIGQSADSLVKVSEETIDDQDFYRRFFAAVDNILGEMKAGKAALEPAPLQHTAPGAPEAVPAPVAPTPVPESVPAPVAPTTAPESLPAQAAPVPAPEPVLAPVAPTTAPESLPPQAAPVAVPEPEPASAPTTPAIVPEPEPSPEQEVPTTAPGQLPPPAVEPSNSITTGT